jgi:hypothetical protein
MTTDPPQRAMITLDLAGEVVSAMVKKNAETILVTKTLGGQRQRDTRNVLMESTFSHFELVSFLAVAIDRLAVHEALTPTPSVEAGVAAFWDEVRKLGTATQLGGLSREKIERIVRAVLDR